MYMVFKRSKQKGRNTKKKERKEIINKTYSLEIQ